MHAGSRVRRVGVRVGERVLTAPAPSGAPRRARGRPEPEPVDALFMAPVDWWWRDQRYQQLARELARLGWRVAYVSPESISATATEPYAFHDGSVLRAACTDTGASDLGAKLIDTDTAARLAPQIQSLFDCRDAAVVVAFPAWFHLASALRPRRLIYDCADLHAGFSHVAEEVVSVEQDLIEAADLTLVTSAPLLERVREEAPGRSVRLLRNGVPGAWRSAAVRPRRAPDQLRVAYVGALEPWIDIQFLATLLERRPGWRLWLIGSGPAAEDLRGRPNIKFFGERPRGAVLDILKRADAGVIPFRQSPLTTAVNPIKLYEYLAVGLPVVATPSDELLELAPPCTILSDSPHAAADALAEAARAPKEEVRRRSATFLEEASWRSRALTLAAYLDDGG